MGKKYPENVAKKKLKESQNKIVAVGTKVMVASVASCESAKRCEKSVVLVYHEVILQHLHGGKEFYVTATAYTAYCNGCSGITATGINLTC